MFARNEYSIAKIAHYAWFPAHDSAASHMSQDKHAPSRRTGSSQVFIDTRWIGEHGIGRFARVMYQSLNLASLRVAGSPSSPLDPLALLMAMWLRTPRQSAVFSPGFNVPLLLARPYVFSIMDLNHIDFPGNSSFLKRFYYRFLMRRVAKRAFRVLTISEFSRQRIIDWACLDPGHVVNVGCGVDPRYNIHTLPHSPGYPYLLCVSNRKPHKNETRVVAAFAQAAVDTGIHLVFTGAPAASLLQVCRQHGVENRVVFTGIVPEDSLPGFYRGAIAMVFPSLYEGFGLPVIEAMACGTPVLTSNTTSLPEIAGDAAVLVDPLSIDAIAIAIKQLCEDHDLRKILRDRGLHQAGKFSWTRVTDKVRSVLDQL